MNKNRKIILAVGTVILVAMIVHPPYFGIDRESGGKLHAFIGYHWIWSPPSSLDVYESLTKSDATGVDPARLASFQARINTIRLMENSVLLSAAIVLGVIFSKKRSKGT